MLVAVTARLLALTLGAALNCCLTVLLVRKKAATALDRLVLAAAVAAGVWQVSTVVALFHHAVAGHESTLLLEAMEQIASGALAVLPALVLHVAMLWSGVRGRFALPGYVAVAPAWWALATGQVEIYGVWLVVALADATALCLWGGRRAADPLMRGFLRAFAIVLAIIPFALWFGGANSAFPAVAALGPPLVMVWYIYRYNLLGLILRPGLVFALQMGAICVLYLLAVRRAADFARDQLEAFGPLVEVALIFAAAMVWLPLYSWMRNFLSKRTQLYTAFGKRVIEDAERILNVKDRVEFLAAEVQRTFGLRRAVVAVGGEPGLDKLFPLAQYSRAEIVRAGDGEIGALVSGLGFNYLFPLRYEGRLNGLLLLDTSPRKFLTEDESILLALSGPIAHSIETARRIEETIALERTLARQEHLTALGRAAAAVAHEVKNPLSTIKALTQLMREDPEVERRYARDLAFILEEVNRLNRTMQQLLSFSRPEPEAQGEVDLSEMLRMTAEVLAREHGPKGVRVEHQIQPGLHLRQASVEALQQIILNVAINAIQASPQGSVVRLTADVNASGSIVIAVTDGGPGIPAEIRERIFEPFFTTRQQGTGLGLAIVRKNVRQMGGAIEVGSPADAGRGTRVTITLPSQ